MVDERTLRTHMHAIRALLAATQERFETLLRDMREGRADAHGAEGDLRRLSEQLKRLTEDCIRMDAYLAERDET